MNAEQAFHDDIDFPWTRPDWWSEDESGHMARRPERSNRVAAAPGPEVKYLTTDQAAVYLGVTERMIRRLADDGRLVVSKVGKYRRFTREALDGAVEVVRLPGTPTTSSTVPADDPVARALQRPMSYPASRNGLRAVHGEG